MPVSGLISHANFSWRIAAKGKYIGAPCNELKCDVKLLHVSCDKETHTCTCERNYPVQLGLIKGCAKRKYISLKLYIQFELNFGYFLAKKLGDQCFYDETCIYNDENSLCVQVRHNAMCQCVSGFHSVSYVKPTRRVFCTPGEAKDISLNSISFQADYHFLQTLFDLFFLLVIFIIKGNPSGLYISSASNPLQTSVN